MFTVRLRKLRITSVNMHNNINFFCVAEDDTKHLTTKKIINNDNNI